MQPEQLALDLPGYRQDWHSAGKKVSCFGAFFSVVSALVGAAAFVGFAIELLSCAPFVLEAVVSEVVVPEVVVPEAEEVLRWITALWPR